MKNRNDILQTRFSWVGSWFAFGQRTGQCCFKVLKLESSRLASLLLRTQCHPTGCGSPQNWSEVLPCCDCAAVRDSGPPFFSQPYLNIFQVLGNTGTPPVPIYLRVVKICQIWDERRLSAVMLTRVGFWFTAISELCYHTCRPLKNWLVGVPDCHNHHCSTYAWRIQR